MKSSTVLNNRKSQLARNTPRDSRYVRSLLQNHNNFKISGEVSRLMYYDGHNWVDYEDKVVEAVRVCWNGIVEVEVEGVLCLFDFYRMLVFDFVSHVEKSVAWIDVKGNCFFPKFEFSSFPDVDSDSLEIQVRVSGGELLNKRKREEVKSAGSFSKKSKVVVCEQEMESMRWNKARVMGEGGKAHSVAKHLFLNWAGIRGIGAEITGIYQVTRNTILDRARYHGFLNQVEMTKAARGDANVAFAWIKASSDNVERFLNHGPHKASSGKAYGFGIYLSPIKSNRVSVMPQDAAENHVILCRVILGNCEKVQAGSQQLYPSSPDFDTGVDDVCNPKWYIVWGANMNTHILPECVVSYKHTLNAVPGQLSTTLWSGQSSAKPNLTWMPKLSDAITAKFFAKLLSCLPSSKLSELRRLWCTYRTGKVPNGIFMKLLRSVVGDQTLRTAIQEVRGRI